MVMNDLRKSQLETTTTSRLNCRFCVMKAWSIYSNVLHKEHSDPNLSNRWEKFAGSSELEEWRGNLTILSLSYDYALTNFHATNFWNFSSTSKFYKEFLIKIFKIKALENILGEGGGGREEGGLIHCNRLPELSRMPAEMFKMMR